MSPAQRDLYLSSVRSIESVSDVSMPDEAGRGWLFVSIEKNGPGDGQRAIEKIRAITSEVNPPFTVVLSSGVDVRNLDEALFHWLANTAPERDMVRTEAGVAFDATAKQPGDERNNHPVRAWPPIIEMDEQMKKHVTGRWNEYFPEGE